VTSRTETAGHNGAAAPGGPGHEPYVPPRQEWRSRRQEKRAARREAALKCRRYLGGGAWKQPVLARCHLLRAGWAALQLPADEGSWQQRVTAEFTSLVQGAEQACAPRGARAPWAALTGSSVEQAWAGVHGAEALLVAMLPPEGVPLVAARAADEVHTHLPRNGRQARLLDQIEFRGNVADYGHRVARGNAGVGAGRDGRDVKAAQPNRAAGGGTHQHYPFASGVALLLETLADLNHRDSTDRLAQRRVKNRDVHSADRQNRGRRHGGWRGGGRQHPVSVGLALLSAHAKSATEHMQIRNFRNTLFLAALVLAAAVGGLIWLGEKTPSALPVCGQRLQGCVLGTTGKGADAATVVTSTAVVAVALVGAAAGVIAGLESLRRLRGTSIPYSVPTALWLLKAPAGALSALLGVLLVRSLPFADDLGMANLGGVLGWAIVFGSSQQLLTRLTDERAQMLMHAVRSGSRRNLDRHADWVRPNGRRRTGGRHDRRRRRRQRR
jgi:hypothetical protein